MDECSKGLGFFADARTSPARTWVLVIHNEFEKYDDRREGNNADVEKLKSAFERRNCIFKELKSNCKNSILKVLQNEEEIFRTFAADQNDMAPDIFVLFILSHGTSAGIIFTDHEMKGSDPKDPQFEYYTKEDVWNGLHENNMPKLRKCLKLIVLGPCRGKDKELRLPAEVETIRKNNVDAKSLWLSTTPNCENFVIFYSTVETTKAQRNVTGTWLVSEFCAELNTMRTDVDLMQFLTRVQRRICTRSTIDEAFGQTPQIQYLSHEDFTVFSYPDDSVDSSSSVETKDIYTWLSDKGFLFRRGRALIFHDRNHGLMAKEYEKSFQFLDFETEIYSILQLEEVVKKVSTASDCGLNEEGCLAVCVLGKMLDNKESGLTIACEDKKISANLIIHSFIGTESKDLAGKPKLFFFLDQGFRDDALFIGKSPQDFAVKGNNHSQFFVFIGRGNPDAGEAGNVVKRLKDELQNPQLKDGLSLQEVIWKLVRSLRGVENEIKPQVSSTLDRQLTFPACKNTYIKPLFILEGYKDPISFANVVEQIVETAKCSGPDDNWRNRSWLLSSSAGLGKSAASKAMTRKLRKKLDDFLIISITLMNICEFLNREEDSDDDADYLRLLEHVLGDNDAVNKGLRSNIEEKKVIVIVDGFDEICPNFEEQVVTYLSQMNGAGIPLWITTRVHGERIIRDRVNKLNVLRLVPMTKPEQIQLLRGILYKNAEECEALLKKFTKPEEENEFTATPLQLKMIAEVADRVDDVEGGLHSLYYLFVLSKVESAMFNYYGTDKTKPKYDELLKEKMELLMKVSMNYLFPKKLPSSTPNSLVLKISANDQDNINQLGIATVTFDDEGRIPKSILFVHQTYAEFLVSVLFLSKSGHFKENKKTFFNDKIVSIDMSQILLKNQFDQVRSFIDHYYEGSKLKEKVDATKLERVCNPTELESNKKDLMAYICKEGHARLFHILFEADFKEHFGDVNLLLNTPFQYDFRNETYSYYPLYAACFSNEDLALHLLEKGAELEYLRPPNCRVEGKGTILHLAARKGLSRIAKKIVEIIPELAYELDESQKTSLDLATDRGHLGCMKIFIEMYSGGKKINIRKKALRNAATKGYSEVVRYLMGEEMDILKDMYGYPPLFLAAEFGHVKLMEDLISWTQDLEVEIDTNGRTAVHGACANKKAEALVFLAEKRANLERKCKEYMHSPLHIAVMHKSTECVRYLLEQGVDVNAKDKNNETPYIHAASNGHLESLKLLEEHGADKFAKSVRLYDQKRNMLGCLTALDRAAMHAETECLDYLLDHDFPPEVKRHAFWLGLAHGNYDDKIIKVLKVFLGKGFSIDFDLETGKTPLILFAKKCQDFQEKHKNHIETRPYFPDDEINKEAPFYPRPAGITYAEKSRLVNHYLVCIKYLIEKGANVNAVTASEGSALHIAAEHGDLYLMDLLITNGANANVCNDYIQRTPLHYAAQSGQLDSVKFLLACEGVNINAECGAGRTALMYAVEKGHTKVIEYLLKRGADTSCHSTLFGCNIVFQAAQLGGKDLDILLSAVKPERQQYELDSALCGAANGGQVDLVIDLAQRGAAITKSNLYKIFSSPLAAAIAGGKEESVRLLLLLMDQESQIEEASAALTTAVRKGNLTIVRLLVTEFFADVNRREENGTSPILIATIAGASEIIRFLLEFEHLDVTTPSHNGNVPILFLFHVKDANVQEELKSRIFIQRETGASSTG